LEGHTDSDGDADANRKLGLDRANAVKAYLISKGIAADKITTTSSGEDKPIADNNTDDGKSLNRRVDMKILKK
jgi:outer membrane protein OmpA-like peptidoglycan-associated protein